ncbi:cysteine desulfurase family protein [Gorillibacterium massiliense]|uniref:cysteine desulfurase family protein n=1 Tax=Gorillibacterium massiliense TaxID=1280390 RepID=UPI0004B30220|nr:cysteine desulfurase family protein [Gorillibacterium massiliense]
MLYLDVCATTPVREEVIKSITDVMAKHYGNPSSIHRFGVEADKLVAKARQIVAEGLDCLPAEILFTSSGTESNNLAVKGAAYANRSRGRHLITTQIEHASVYESFKQLEQEGFEVTYLPADSTGAVSLDDLKTALREDTILVSIMHVNNEMGRIQPVKEIGAFLLERPRTLFHVDAIQSYGKLAFTPQEIGADLMSASAHKFRGPKGTAFLYRREGVRLATLLAGGGQEFGLRSGTENVPLLVGMAKAARLVVEEQATAFHKLHGLRKRLAAGLADIPGLIVSGADDPTLMAPHIVHFTLDDVRSEVLVHALEEADIYVSARSACSSGSIVPSRVLLSMGMSEERAVSGIRVSFSPEQTPQDMDHFVDELKKAVQRLRM